MILGIIGLVSYLTMIVLAPLYFQEDPIINSFLLNVIIWFLSFLLFSYLSKKLKLYPINKFVVAITIVILFYVSANLGFVLSLASLAILTKLL